MREKPTYEDLEQKIAELKIQLSFFKNKIEMQDRQIVAKPDFISVIENTDDIIAVWDLDGHLIAMNKAFRNFTRKLFHIDIKAGIRTIDYLDSEQKEYWEKVLSRVLKGERIREEFSYQFEDGEIRYHDTTFNPIIQDGEVIGTSEFTRDITKYKIAGNALIESEKKYRLLFNGVNEAIFVHQPLIAEEPQTFIEINDAACKLYGYTREELLKLSPADLMPKEQREKAKRFIHKTLSKGQNVFNVLHETKSGKRISVEISSYVFTFTERQTIISIVRDVSESKRIEAALRDSEEKYRVLFSQSSMGIYLHDIKGKILDVNQIACTQTGYSKSELLKLNVFDLHPNTPDTINLSKDSILQIWSQWQTGQRHTYEGEHRRKDGTIFPIEVSTGIVTYGDEKNIIALCQDITERKQAEEALRESEEKFRLLSEQSLMAIVIVQDGGIKYANQAYSAMSGYTWEEIMNWTEYDIVQTIYPEDRHFVMEQGRKKASGSRDGIVTHYSYRGLTKSGEVRWIDQYSKTITYKGKPANFLTFIDIHNQKVAQETLRQSQKRYRDLADSLPQVIFETDENGKLTFVNYNAFDVFGYTQRGKRRNNHI